MISLYDWRDIASAALLGWTAGLLIAAYLYRSHRPAQPRCPKCQAWCSPRRAHVCRKP